MPVNPTVFFFVLFTLTPSLSRLTVTACFVSSDGIKPQQQRPDETRRISSERPHYNSISRGRENGQSAPEVTIRPRFYKLTVKNCVQCVTSRCRVKNFIRVYTGGIYRRCIYSYTVWTGVSKEGNYKRSVYRSKRKRKGRTGEKRAQ